MSGSNLPPGVTVGMIPGNRPEDTEWEEFGEWALEQFVDLSSAEARRAVVAGIAAVKAEREYVKILINDILADQAQYISYLEAKAKD